jgi:hypothetical protein
MQWCEPPCESESELLAIPIYDQSQMLLSYISSYSMYESLPSDAWGRGQHRMSPFGMSTGMSTVGPSVFFYLVRSPSMFITSENSSATLHDTHRHTNTSRERQDARGLSPFSDFYQFKHLSKLSCGFDLSFQ